MSGDDGGVGDVVFRNKKKKPRYSRAQKRERKEQQQDEGTSQHNQPPQQRKKNKTMTKKNKPSALEKIHLCIDQSLHTDSVMIDGSATTSVTSSTTIGIVSGCDWEESKRKFPSEQEDSTRSAAATISSASASSSSSPSNEMTIRVQPLLILDLNGILCHRSRQRKEPIGVKLRQPIGVVAQTPVVPRHDLGKFLRYLDQHFCVAVWTSAKPKTAARLIELLFPHDVKRRLLFVWSQKHCDKVLVDPTKATTSVSNGSDESSVSSHGSSHSNKNNQVGDTWKEHEQRDNVTYEKNLRKVWDVFPLWSANNTLLVDDTPDKCPFAVANAVHPPRLHGRDSTCKSISNAQHQDGSTSQLLLSDEDNVQMQSIFFERLVQFWKEQPYKEKILISRRQPRGGDTASINIRFDKSSLEILEEMTNSQYNKFLATNATTDMGWRSS
jgi:hypothetical protein